jgi:hypothetical protein
MVEGVKKLVDLHTGLPAVAWGAGGAAAVSANYGPVRDYQVKQMEDFVKCLHGIRAGLYSVVVHYDQVELANAQHANDVATDLSLKAAAQMKLHALQQTVTKDNEDLSMAKSRDDSYH